MTIKECTIFFDTDYYQLMRKPHKQPPIANLVCDVRNVGTIEIGYWGFNMYNTLKRVPVHSSYVGDLYKLSQQLKADTVKHILYNTVISVLYGFMIEENENDDTIYMVKTPYSHYPMGNDIHNPTGLESFVDACYVYLNDTYEDDKKIANIIPK